MKRILIAECLPTLCLVLLTASHAQGQYFGKNKVGYRTFDFKTLSSPHFDFYHYTNDSIASFWLKTAEKWYDMHSHFLKDTLKTKNPLVMYENHPDFQQTTVFDFTVEVGTGGITEGMKNRVVMPITEYPWQTNHVLGHELVHAFQYNMLKNSDSLSLGSTRNLPLWMIEGMAEFLSLGRNDTNTSLWMRDAVLYHYFPSLSDLNNPKYFPYRYGQAFWAFVTGVWGDQVLRPLFVETGKHGVEEACLRVLGYNSFTISNMWRETNKNYYTPLMRKKDKDKLVGQVLLSPEEVGKINVMPSVSPNGQYLVFLSRKDVITMSYYLYDVKKEKIVRRISSLTRASHIDFMSSYESAATWSPDGEQFALVVWQEGKNALSIINAENGSIHDEILSDELPAFSHPQWSPDGQHIVVSGLKSGLNNLYLINVDTKQLRQITDDAHAYIHPSWAPNGQQLVFATDKDGAGMFHLAIWNKETQTITHLPLFDNCDNVNPQFVDNETLMFLSDRDGFRNFYTYHLPTKTLLMRTDYPTGITGITKYSKALSYSATSEQAFYNLYRNGEYVLIKADKKDWLSIPVEPNDVDKDAGCLPPKFPVKPEKVSEAVENLSKMYDEDDNDEDNAIREVPYRPRFGLEYVSNPTVGVGVSQFGTGAAGGVGFGFSDILKNNDVFAFASISGEIYDLGGGVRYVYKKHRTDWGVAFSHIPYLATRFSVGRENLEVQGKTLEVTNYRTDVLRTFEDRLGVFAYFPLSKIKRWEALASTAYYSYRYDRYNEYYAAYSFLDRQRERLPGQPSFFLHSVAAAYVGDNATNGLVGPLDGYRYRFQVAQYLGRFFFQEVGIDFRSYRWYKPIGLALRLLHQGRYGPNSENNFLFPYNIGFPWLVRGYNYWNIYRGNRQLNNNNVSGQFYVNDLVGSHMAVGNAEIRVPFTGPKNLALLPFGYLGTELTFFFDSGIVWSSTEYKQNLFGTTVPENLRQRPIYSTGVSLRANVLGALVLEPFYAIPLTRTDVELGIWGLNFLFPAW